MDPAPGQEAALAITPSKPYDHMRCCKKGELPSHFHYGRNPRVPAFICLAGVAGSSLTEQAAASAATAAHTA